MPWKPGHWTSVVLSDLKANDDDYQGDLEAVVGGKDWLPARIEDTDSCLVNLRKVVLPKGQAKTVETPLFASGAMSEKGAVFRLKDSRGASSSFHEQHPALCMPPNQYHCFVLARQPSRYKYLASMPAIAPVTGFGDTRRPFLLLHFAGGDKPAGRILMPGHAMFSTSMACLLWDDADPAWLDPRQQQAIIDWLHWGGLLIVSGPDSLDSLRGSFLEPYLPARADGTLELTSDDLASLGAFAPNGAACRLAQPQTAVRWQVDEPASQLVPATGGLVAERRVGRGRVVVSAFRLGSSELTKWPGWDCMFNACLLRRPARNYSAGNDLPEGAWADGSSFDDSAKISGVRYFSRDFAASPRDSENGIDSEGILVENQRAGGGVASWNDHSPAAERARTALSRAAQIAIPARSFILWTLLGYLAVLGPVNWCFFRILGRVEWLWAAAPVIAIVWTVVVIRTAQLDIGFVRSRTEIDVIELHAGHARGHLTRYAALYTSLTTEYAFQFDDPAAAILPWDQPKSQREATMPRETLSCRRGENLELTGLVVPSNSVRFVHGEQMIDLQGGLELSGNDTQGWKVRNATGLDLQGAGLLRRDKDGRISTAWIGSLASGAAADVAIDVTAVDPTPSAWLWKLQREGSPRTCAAANSGDLNLRSLLDLAGDTKSLAPGDARLVAYIDGNLPGMDVSPAAMQTRSATVVVAHVAFGFGDAPQPDVAAPQDLQR